MISNNPPLNIKSRIDSLLLSLSLSLMDYRVLMHESCPLERKKMGAVLAVQKKLATSSRKLTSLRIFLLFTQVKAYENICMINQFCFFPLSCFSTLKWWLSQKYHLTATSFPYGTQYIMTSFGQWLCVFPSIKSPSLNMSSIINIGAGTFSSYIAHVWQLTWDEKSIIKFFLKWPWGWWYCHKKAFRSYYHSHALIRADLHIICISHQNVTGLKGQTTWWPLVRTEFSWSTLKQDLECHRVYSQAPDCTIKNTNKEAKQASGKKHNKTRDIRQ